MVALNFRIIKTVHGSREDALTLEREIRRCDLVSVEESACSDLFADTMESYVRSKILKMPLATELSRTFENKFSAVKQEPELGWLVCVLQICVDNAVPVIMLERGSDQISRRVSEQARGAPNSVSTEALWKGCIDDFFNYSYNELLNKLRLNFSQVDERDHLMGTNALRIH